MPISSSFVFSVLFQVVKPGICLFRITILHPPGTPRAMPLYKTLDHLHYMWFWLMNLKREEMELEKVWRRADKMIRGIQKGAG